MIEANEAAANATVAAVAVARELAGFVWALMQESVAEIEAGRRAA